MRDAEFLNWLADRIVHVYGESNETDFVTKLRSIATLTPPLRNTSNVWAGKLNKNPLAVEAMQQAREDIDREHFEKCVEEAKEKPTSWLARFPWRIKIWRK